VRVRARKLSVASMRNIKQNLFFALVYNSTTGQGYQSPLAFSIRSSTS